MINRRPGSEVLREPVPESNEGMETRKDSPQLEETQRVDDWRPPAAPPSVAARRRRDLARISQSIYFFFGMLNGLIAIRFLLKLLGASADAPFTALLYGITEPFVAPFRGMFPVYDTGVGAWEPHSVVAFVIYALLGWAVVQVLWLVFREP